MGLITACCLATMYMCGLAALALRYLDARGAPPTTPTLHSMRGFIETHGGHGIAIRGCAWLSSSHNGNSRNDVRRGKPRAKRGAACSMRLSIDRSTYSFMCVRSVRRARGSSGSHGHISLSPWLFYLLLCCSAE